MKNQPIQRTVRLGARGSMLARMQSQLVADALEKRHPGLIVELVIHKTGGDIINDRPLHDVGGKGLFTRELEQALLDGGIDLAVHSFKDVPVTMPLVATDKLAIAAVPQREDGRDVLIADAARTLGELPAGTRVGTGSLRRRCQLLALRPDLRVEPIRGNIDTRLQKQSAGEYDAVVLALAGLRRAGLFDAARMSIVPLEELLPAAGQGALAVQCRGADMAMRRLLAPLDDSISRDCVAAERHLVERLGGDCHSPIGVLAEVAGDRALLRAAVGGRDGTPPLLRAQASGASSELEMLVESVYAELCRQNVHARLGTRAGRS